MGIAAKQKQPDGPANIVELSEKDISKFKKVKDGENFLDGDLLFIIDNRYAQISGGSPLSNKKISKDNIVYRKK